MSSPTTADPPTADRVPDPPTHHGDVDPDRHALYDVVAGSRGPPRRDMDAPALARRTADNLAGLSRLRVRHALDDVAEAFAGLLPARREPYTTPAIPGCGAFLTRPGDVGFAPVHSGGEGGA